MDKSDECGRGRAVNKVRKGKEEKMTENLIGPSKSGE